MTEVPAYEFTWSGRLFRVFASGHFEVDDSPFTPGTEMVINRIPLLIARSDGAIYQAVSHASMTAQEAADMDRAIEEALVLNAPARSEPGFKEDDTAREAAERIRARAEHLRCEVWRHICNFPLSTSDEIAVALGETPWNIRPRVSELRKAGLVINDGRGKSINGNPAHRWRAK